MQRSALVPDLTLFNNLIHFHNSYYTQEREFGSFVTTPSFTYLYDHQALPYMGIEHSSDSEAHHLTT